MSRLDQLISQYCPAGVPMVRLGEVCEIKRGERLVRKDLDKIGEYPVFQNSLTPLGFYSSFNREKYTPFVISAGAAGSVGICSSEYWAADDCFTLDETCNIAPKYLYYGLLNQEDFLKSKIRGGAMKRLARDIVENLSIPLPPLPVQEEIVCILDAMSDLVTNLDAEISARQKQYEHAREKLLTFGEEVERKTLGEVGEMIKGSGIMKSDFVDIGKPCIHYGQIHTYYQTSTTKTKSYIDESLYDKSKYAVPGDLVIATTSEDVEACCKACAWLGDEPVAVSGDAHIFHHTQNAKYMSYLFQTEQFAAQKRLAATGAKVVRVAGNSILKFEFPLPSLSVQQSIVERLDKMESLIQNLQAERTVRQKQYEYYRERLLLFAK